MTTGVRARARPRRVAGIACGLLSAFRLCSCRGSHGDLGRGWRRRSSCCAVAGAGVAASRTRPAGRRRTREAGGRRAGDAGRAAVRRRRARGPAPGRSPTPTSGTAATRWARTAPLLRGVTQRSHVLGAERRRPHAQPRGPRHRLARLDDRVLELVGPIAGARRRSPRRRSRRSPATAVLGATLKVDPGTLAARRRTSSATSGRAATRGPRVRADRRRDRRDPRGRRRRPRPRARRDRPGPLAARRRRPSSAWRPRRRRRARRRGGVPGPVEPGRRPLVACRDPAGQAADRRRRLVVRLRRDHVTRTSGTAATRPARTARRSTARPRRRTRSVAKDVGKTLGFAVRATDTTGTTNAYASLVGPVAGPRCHARLDRRSRRSPARPKEGQTLQVSAGGWTHDPGRGRRTSGSAATRTAVSARRSPARPRAPTPSPPPTPGTRSLAVVHATVGSRIAGRAQRRDSGGHRRADAGPSSTALPTVAGTQPAGHAAHRLDREAGRARARSATPTSGTAATPAGAHCTLDPRRDEGDLHARSRRTSARRSASPSARPTPPAPPRPTRASSGRSPPPAPRSSRRRSRRSRARRSRARRSRSREAAGAGRPTALTYAVAALQPERPPLHPDRRRDGAPPTPSTAADAGHALLAVVQARRTASRSATLSVATAVVSDFTWTRGRGRLAARQLAESAAESAAPEVDDRLDLRVALPARGK